MRPPGWPRPIDSGQPDWASFMVVTIGSRASEEAARLLAAKLRDGALTARGLHKVARVARTVADLAGAEQVDAEHIADALCLRTARRTVTR